MTRTFIFLAVFVITGAMSFAQSADNTEWHKLKNRLQTERRRVVNENMMLTTSEHMIFSELYEKYEFESKAAGINRFDGLKRYLERRESLNEDELADLMDVLLKKQTEGIRLRKKYYRLIKKNLSVAHAVRFVQLEEQCNALIRVALLQEFPLMNLN